MQNIICSKLEVLAKEWDVEDWFQDLGSRGDEPGVEDGAALPERQRWHPAFQAPPFMPCCHIASTARSQHSSGSWLAMSVLRRSGGRRSTLPYHCRHR
jgi:hypothetical protein